MTPLKKAELFAKTKHGGELNEIGVPHSNHLENVVSRLKSLGVIDEEVLCAIRRRGVAELHGETASPGSPSWGRPVQDKLAFAEPLVT